jgi:hypothetical protein
MISMDSVEQNWVINHRLMRIISLSSRENKTDDVHINPSFYSLFLWVLELKHLLKKYKINCRLKLKAMRKCDVGTKKSTHKYG